MPVTPEPRSVVIVTDQLPHPPRNGITIPVYNYACGLAERRSVRLVVLEDVERPFDDGELEANRALFGDIGRIRFVRFPLHERIAMEVRGRQVVAHGWRPREAARDVAFSTRTLIVSPMSAVAKWQALGLAKEHGSVWVAGINDCLTSEYRYRHLAVGSPKTRLKGMVDFVRSMNVRRIEAAYLSAFDRILVQTKADRDHLASLVGELVAARAVIAPNGVHPELFELAPQPTADRVTFVAELSGEYAPVARWIVEQVWPKARARHPRMKLHVVGKGASPELGKLLATTEGVVHDEFVASLADIYRGSCAVLSPVFKGYGLINKTIEAMASGLVVVGGRAAFNGIDGFVSGVHGLVVSSRRDVDELVSLLDRVLRDASARRQIGANARELVRRQFDWRRTLSVVESALEPVRVEGAPAHGRIHSG